MAQLEISQNLYERLQQQASSTGQSVEAWLSQQVEPTPDQQLAEFHSWFVRLVAHDLRTPLAAIMSSSDLLKHYRDRLTEARKVEHLDTIQMQVRLLNHLLDNIMVIQKFESGALAASPMAQDLEAVCHEAVEDVGEVVHDLPDIQVDVHDAVPPVPVDEKLLGMALFNLLHNAVHYAAGGACVHLALIPAASEVMIRISDEGIGIPPEEQDQVFDLFYRASNVQNLPGKGLGLPVAGRIVELHHGRIQLDSALGQGTTVTMTLPLSI